MSRLQISLQRTDECKCSAFTCNDQVTVEVGLGPTAKCSVCYASCKRACYASCGLFVTGRLDREGIEKVMNYFPLPHVSLALT